MKTLDFHYSVLADFKEKYRRTKNQHVKQVATRFVCGKIVRKFITANGTVSAFHFYKPLGYW